MKTLTEFGAAQLKNAAKTKAELAAAGKTPEELPAALGEALKLEGDRLNLLLNAIELIETKQNDLKRVIVHLPAEGEKAPAHAQQKGEHFYSIEYYPPIAKKGGDTQEFKGRGDKRGKRDGKKRGRKGDRPRRNGPPRGDRNPQGPVAAQGATEGGTPKKVVIIPRANPPATETPSGT